MPQGRQDNHCNRHNLRWEVVPQQVGVNSHREGLEYEWEGRWEGSLHGIGPANEAEQRR
jgi:hypothetical protein